MRACVRVCVRMYVCTYIYIYLYYTYTYIYRLQHMIYVIIAAILMIFEFLKSLSYKAGQLLIIEAIIELYEY